MNTSKFPRIAKAILVSAIVGATSVGCAAPAKSPGQAVELAFKSFTKGKKAGVNKQLSPVGKASAEFFCMGDGWACMQDSYARLGKNLTNTVEVTRQAGSSARVQLKTTWVKYPSSVCQEYSVDRTGAGWGISYIDVPKKC